MIVKSQFESTSLNDAARLNTQQKQKQRQKQTQKAEAKAKVKQTRKQMSKTNA